MKIEAWDELSQAKRYRIQRVSQELLRGAAQGEAFSLEQAQTPPSIPNYGHIPFIS
jgi:hypothetical protein